jgi:hypothetical protein
MRFLLLSAALLAGPLSAQVPTAPAPAPTEQASVRLDKGHLDPAWFHLPAASFAPVDLADFGWIKPGFKLGGRSLKVLWEAPQWTDPKMEEDNLAAADAHRANFPKYLQTSLGAFEGVKVSAEAGDLLLVGRLVECNTKGGMMSWAVEAVTYDLKLVDPATGETLLAFHHRLLGGFGTKGNGSRRRFQDWAEQFAAYAKRNWLP